MSALGRGSAPCTRGWRWDRRTVCTFSCRSTSVVSAWRSLLLLVCPLWNPSPRPSSRRCSTRRIATMCGPASAKAQTCGQVLSLLRRLSRARSFTRCRLARREAGEPSGRRDGVAEFASSLCSMPLRDTCVTVTSSTTSRRSHTFFPRVVLLRFAQQTSIGARVGNSPTRKSSPTFRGPLKTAWSTSGSAGHRAPHGLVLGGARALVPDLRVAGQRCWGLPGLYRWEQARLHEANTLLLHSLAMAEAVSCRGGGHLLEHPEDPGCFPYASIWDLPETHAM